MSAGLAPNPSRTLDLIEARRFLEALDPDAKAWTFQTFDEDKNRGDKKLARVFHGTVEEHASALMNLQERGAGVFVTVNRTDLQGRDESNITSVRAVFGDFDGAPLGNKDRLKREPHIVVRSSPGKWHVYYRVEGVPLDRFKGAQKALSGLFGSDAAVCDLPRVMRLPGTWHLKGEPFMTRVEAITTRRPYGLSELPVAGERDDDPAANVVRLDDHRAPLDPDTECGVAEGGRSDFAYKWASKWRGEDVPLKEALSKMRVFCDGCVPPYPRRDGEDIVRRAYKKYEPNKAEKPKRKAPVAQVDQLVKIAQTASVWRVDQTAFYATVQHKGRVEHLPLSGQDFRRWLTREYFNATKGRSPGSQAVVDATKVLEAISTEAPIHRTARRVGEHGGKLYVDICDHERRAVEIDEDGWRIVPQPPVRFVRSSGMQELPLPVSGGSIEGLRPFINAGDASFRLLVATMLAYMRPRGPFPILAIHGEHGTAKSSTSRFVLNLIDPHDAELRRAPREDRDLVTAANASWVLAFDNLSSVPQWMSDSFCMISTSGSYTARALRTDYEEVILSNLNRPLLLNGINDIDQYPDLTSRTIRVVLDPIPEDERKTEEAIRSAFAAARPRLLGALYTAASSAMRRLPMTKLDRLPRLADFAMWATAAEEGLGWEPGSFMAAFDANQEASVLDGLAGDTVAQCVVGFVADRGSAPNAGRPFWEGTASELYAALEPYVSEEAKRNKYWPGSSRHLSGRLRKLAPGLRVAGVNLDLTRKDTARNVGLIALYHTGELGITGFSLGGSPNEGNVPSAF